MKAPENLTKIDIFGLLCMCCEVIKKRQLDRGNDKTGKELAWAHVNGHEWEKALLCPPLRILAR